MNRSLPPRRVCVVEPLETRAMMNGADGPIVLVGTDGPDKIEIYYAQLAGGHWSYNYNINGVGKGLYDFDASQIKIYGKGGNDKITVYSLQFAPISIYAGAGDDQIALPGVRTIYSTYVDGGTGTNTLTAGMDKNFSVEVNDPRFIDSYDVTSTTLQRSYYDTVIGLTHHMPPVTYANLQQVTFMTSGGNVQTNVHSTAAGCVTTIFGGAGKNVFNVGDGNLDTNLLGHLSLLGQGGADTVNFTDFVDSGDDVYTLNAASLEKAGTGGANFYDIESINLVANGGNNTINVNAVSSFATVNISGWGGNDRFYVGNRNYAGNISGKLILSGSTGSDQLQFNDQDDLGADIYTLSEGTFSKTGLKYATTFSQMELTSIGGNMDPNIFEVAPSATTRFVTYGRGPGFDGVGDVLHVHVDGALNPTRYATLPGVGYFTFFNRQQVIVSGVETTTMVGTVAPITLARVNAGGFLVDTQHQTLASQIGLSGATKF